MSETPRILGVHWCADDDVCRVIIPFPAGVSAVNSSGGDLSGVIRRLPLSSITSFLNEHQSDQIRVLISSNEECWFQRPSKEDDPVKDFAAGLHDSLAGAILLEADQGEVVEQFIHSLKDMPPLSVWLRSELLDRFSRQIPQQIPVAYFTEASLAPYLAGDAVRGYADREKAEVAASVLLFFVARRYVSACWVSPAGKQLMDAMRIPFSFAEDLVYLVEQATAIYPWLKGTHDLVAWVGVGEVADDSNREIDEAVKIIRDFHPSLKELPLADGGLGKVVASGAGVDMSPIFQHIK